jgi:hypothetical protein
MSKIIAFALALTLAASAKAEPRCDMQPDNIARCLVPIAASIESAKVAQGVLCCCKTYSGGECCARVAVCGGKIPGCFCASPGVPGAQQQSSVRH